MNQSRLIHYQCKLSRYQLWLDKADHLWDAAQLLRPKIQKALDSHKQQFFEDPKSLTDPFPSGALDVYFLLAGLAVENLLKAKWIKQNRRTLKNERFIGSALPNDIRTHNMFALARKLKLRISADESELLQYLSEHVRWAGRYPVPTKAEDLKPRTTSEEYMRNVGHLISKLYCLLWRKRIQPL